MLTFIIIIAFLIRESLYIFIIKHYPLVDKTNTIFVGLQWQRAAMVSEFVNYLSSLRMKKI